MTSPNLKCSFTGSACGETIRNRMSRRHVSQGASATWRAKMSSTRRPSGNTGHGSFETGVSPPTEPSAAAALMTNPAINKTVPSTEQNKVQATEMAGPHHIITRCVLAQAGVGRCRCCSGNPSVMPCGTSPGSVRASYEIRAGACVRIDPLSGGADCLLWTSAEPPRSPCDERGGAAIRRPSVRGRTRFINGATTFSSTLLDRLQAGDKDHIN